MRVSLTMLLESIFSWRQAEVASIKAREMSCILDPNLPRYEFNGEVRFREQLSGPLQAQRSLKAERRAPNSG